MKLDRLHIQGFKSFKDRTTINFDEGITGIVGPNGCGKSNIVDALFWVMGEQSAKHLRGKSMKDLIFAGSEKYTPANWAEVTLVLNNDSGKHIHIGTQVVQPPEIQLTRKLYRNGDTEYRINGEPARLKDVQEVFMDTGAGAKSYAIIAQGEINRLVQAKPQERRNMIEEVAGITKFKLRRRESMKKLENTEQNLNRLQDLQTEIRKNLKGLEKQAEKANRARSLKEKIKRHELIAESHKEFEFLNDFIIHNEKLDLKTKLTTEFKESKEQLEENLSEERDVKDVQAVQIESAQDDFNEKSKELAKSEQRLDFIQKNIEEKNKQFERRAHENGELLNDIEERTAKLTELEGSFAGFKEQELSEDKLEELTSVTSLLKDEMEELISTINENKKDVLSLKDDKNNFFQKKEANALKLEECSRQLEDITIEIEELEKEDSTFSQKLVQERDQKEKLEIAFTEKTEALENTEASFTQAKEAYETLNKELAELNKEVTFKELTLKSLLDVNAQFDQAFEATEELSQTEMAGYDLIGNLIETSQENSKVIETISRHLLKTVVFENNESRDGVIDWIKNNNSNGIEFTIPTTEKFDLSETAERLEIKGFKNITAIQDLMTVNKQELAESVSRLFNGYLLVDSIDLDLAKTLTPALRFKAIIDRECKVLIINNGNAVFVQSLNQNIEAEGMVARNNKISELELDLGEKRKSLNLLEESFFSSEEQFNELKDLKERTYAEFIDLNTEYTGLKSSLEARESVKNSGDTKLNQLSLRKSELSVKRLDLMEGDESLAQDFSSQDDRINELDLALVSLDERFLNNQTTYEEKRNELVQLQALAKTYESQLASFESQIEDNANQISRYQEKLEQNRVFQEGLKAELEGLEQDLQELKTTIESEKESLEEEKSELDDLKETFSELLLAMQERENEVRELTQKINKLEKECVEHMGKIEKVIEGEEIVARNIFEKYQIDLREDIAAFLEVTDVEKLSGLTDLSTMFVMETENGPETILKNSFSFIKKFPGEVRESRDKFKRYRSELNRLGEINWQAVQDYDRQKLRYDFLRAQEIELRKSLQDLETAIEHIDQKSRERFKVAFKEVNDRFMKVFPIIFGGGNAHLNIIGHIDSPECGIDIIAQPPGKKMQSINLMSGGEKAMTAVSLIFSVFLVKPSPFCLLDEVDAPLDDANVGRFNELLREMSSESQFILITHNKKTMELNDTLYGVTMQEPGVSSAVSVQLH